MSVWAGCAINPVSGRPELTLISEKFEQELGDEEAKKIEAGMGFSDDTGFTPFLNQLGQRLAEHSPRKNVTFQFHIVDMAEPNAFALPGGYVYVSRGLLALTNTEGELAGVVGHEIGHVAGKHAVQRISNQAPFAVVFGTYNIYRDPLTTLPGLGYGVCLAHDLTAASGSDAAGALKSFESREL